MKGIERERLDSKRGKDNKEYSFFEYISDNPNKDNFRLKLKLSDYVSHELVGRRFSVKSLNTVDRISVAEKFLDKNREYFKRHNSSVFNLYDNRETYPMFKQEIALYIDLKIPYFYFIKKNNISGHKGRSYYDGILSASKTMKYKIKESQDLEYLMYDTAEGATKKQKNYLRDLLQDAGYKLKVDYDELSKYQARKLIGFLVKDEEITEKMFNELVEYDI